MKVQFLTLFFLSFASMGQPQDLLSVEIIASTANSLVEDPSLAKNLAEEWANANMAVSSDIGGAISASTSQVDFNQLFQGIPSDTDWAARIDGNEALDVLNDYSIGLGVQGVDMNEMSALAIVIKEAQIGQPPGANKFCLPPIVWFCSLKQ